MITIQVQTPPCMLCGRSSTLELTPSQFGRLQTKGINSLTDLSVDDRELLINGTHSTVQPGREMSCWDQMMGPEPKD